MPGMEMMLINMLKAFMPKEAAEKIAGYATDGTFDRIGAIPSELDEIKARLCAIQVSLNGLTRRQIALLNNEPQGSNPLLGIADECRPVPPASTEYGTNGAGASAGTSLGADNRHEGSA